MKKKVCNIFVRTIDREMSNSNRLITKWEQVTNEISLGSIKNPNKEILEVRFEPITNRGEIF